jgi:tetratricopeptide (TPR) repeat protein
MRFLLPLLFLFLQSAGMYAQTHSIDSMRSRLPFLSGTAQADCLNRLSEQFCYHWIHSDSSLHYSSEAFKQASINGYKIGMSEALILEGEVKGKLLGQPREMLVVSKKAIEIIKTTNDQRTLCRAYKTLSGALTFLGEYQNAIDMAVKARQIALTLKDKSLIGWSAETIGFVYIKSGLYWKAFENFIEAQQVGKELNDSLLVSVSLAFIARSFNRVGEPGKALEYYHEFLRYAGPFTLLWPHLEDMAFAHLQLKQYDSVLYYQQKHRLNIELLTMDLKLRKKFSSWLMGFSSDVQIERQQYDSVLLLVLPNLTRQRESMDYLPLMNSLLIAGKAYLGKGDYPKSMLYSRELYQLATKIDNKQFLKDATEQLSKTFERLHQSDSAYVYFRQYTALKDSMETAKYAGRTALFLAASEAENKIRLLQKDNEQQLTLNKNEIQRQVQLKNMMIACFVLAVLFSIIIASNLILKRKNEKLRNDQEQSILKRKALELEMQALRAQMNPHFIFNCLSAIDSLIQTNQSDKATTCLSRFAKLIRGVLDGSKNNLVPFEKDFETMKLYLEMEQFRCNDKFTYDLYADDELLQGDYKVPPLIIQPFIENAIHHGLLNKQNGHRQIKVRAQLGDKHIIYAITDNGVGRKKAAALRQMNKPGQQSYGIEITKERIQLHNKNDVATDLVITDLEEGGISLGTKAVIRINCFE